MAKVQGHTDNMDNYDDQDFLSKAKQKALELMGKTVAPGMGSAKMSDYGSGLDQAPVPVENQAPQYASPEDQKTAETLRNAKRDLLTGGGDEAAGNFYFKGNHPSQQDVDNYSRSMSAGMTSGTAQPRFGRVVEKFSTPDKIQQAIQTLRKDMTPENIEKIKLLSQKLYGTVK